MVRNSKQWKVDDSRPLSAEDLPLVTHELQKGGERDSDSYRKLVHAVGALINQLKLGSIKEIDVDELQNQVGHLIYFKVRDSALPLPYDLEFLGELLSHFKNPTLIVLKRIRHLLMDYHRKILSRLEEDQAEERRLDFKSMDISALTRSGAEQMQRFETEARLSQSISRKLDKLTLALHVPARFNASFRLLDRILTDPYHLRHQQAMDWFQVSMFRGDMVLLRKVVSAASQLLENKSQTIFGEIEKFTGIHLNRDVNGLDSGFTWYSLGTPTGRGNDFVRIFEEETRVENALRRLNFFMIRSTWRVEVFQEVFERNKPVPRKRQENCGALARLYQELETKIQESSGLTGEAQVAINSDLEHGLLSQEEAAEARTWVLENKIALHQLKLEIFQVLVDQLRDYPTLVLPGCIHELVSEPTSHRGAGFPKLQILDLHRETELLETRTTSVDGQVLAELVQLLHKLDERKALLTHIDFQRQLRAACQSASDYEDKLVEHDKVDQRLDDMRERVRGWILRAWREVLFATVDEDVIEDAFAVVIDHMLASLKLLNYQVMDADVFSEAFNLALALPHQDSLFQLDQLLHEIHSIPKQNQILSALSDWENVLSKKDFEEKQSYILKNELMLQALVDQVRSELRERIGACELRPRRLRFEVFSLADCFAGNLRSLLKGLLRMAALVSSAKDGERLISNLQAIEVQVIEAQRITKPGGQAHQKLVQLKRQNLLSQPVVEDLFVDLEANFSDLNDLLAEVNQGLDKVRVLLNRFGGDHDTQHLSVVINIHDLEQLKQTYQFVDSITMMDIKRFGVIYQQRAALMNDVFERANQKDPALPAPILKVIDAKAYRAYKERSHVPIALKAAIFREIPEVLEFECELLIRSLNLVSDKEIRSKVVYRGVILMMELAKGANIEGRRVLRRIWLKFRNTLQAYKPRNLKANYENNMRSLLTDVQAVLGDLFDDL